MRTEDTHPAPSLADWNRPYFEAAEEGKLVLQRCDSCGQLIYYPRIACPHCLSNELTWEEVAGQGTVYSYSIVWRPQHPSFTPHIPIIMATVELAEGPMMVTSIENCEPDAVEIGMAVEICFTALDGGPVLPRFRPANP